jgi:lipid-A-disaccharide synthase
LRNNPPDAVVLIDYPGFNLRLAEAIAPFNIPVIYYISPQVWAWKRKRVYTLARVADKMLVIFPFEVPLYEAAGLPCVYVGHPLVDGVAAYRAAHPTQTGETPHVVGLFPGSREQEIARLLAPMLATAQGIRAKYPDARFVTPCVNAAGAAQVRAIAGDFPLEVMEDPDGDALYAALSVARFALVASGTATLETALFGVPMLIAYQVNPLTYALAKRLVRVEHIGIVNIIAGRRIVPEFLQTEVTAERMLPAALELIADSPARQTMLAELDAVREKLGGGGASDHAAQEILALLA